MNSAFKTAIKAIESSQHVLIIQAENPDADSLASSLALESILGARGKKTTLYCHVTVPKYLRYLPGWDRVVDQFPTNFDTAIVVDASSRVLMERTLKEPGARRLAKGAVVVIDHHTSDVDLPMPTINILDKSAVATGQVIAGLVEVAGWVIDAAAADMIATSIMADSLGLSSSKVTAATVYALAHMIEKGADLAKLEEKRRELAKKPWDIFRYKGQLFERVELHLNSQLALITIPWEEIEEHSDAYNPTMLIIDEMRLIEGVKVAAAFKLYPDGKITAKLRANTGAEFMDQLAKHFGGGGHPSTAGFKVYGTPYETLLKEFLKETQEELGIKRG